MSGLAAGDLFVQWSSWAKRARVSGLAELAIAQNARSYASPDVNDDAEPGRADLDPHARLVGRERLQVVGGLEPVGERHHDVESGQEEYEVAARVGVGNLVALVVPHFLAVAAILVVLGLAVAQRGSLTARGAAYVDELVALTGRGEARVEDDEEPEDERDDARSVEDVVRRVADGRRVGGGAVVVATGRRDDAHEARVAVVVAVVAHR